MDISLPRTIPELIAFLQALPPSARVTSFGIDPTTAEGEFVRISVLTFEADPTRGTLLR